MKFLIFSFLFIFTIRVCAQNFLPATEDIPQMDGLYHVEENATFDSPSEKMTLVSALTKEKPKKVMQYYRQVLINLGWSSLKNNHYVRGKDTLSLEITPQGSTYSIQFTLVQKN